MTNREAIKWFYLNYAKITCVSNANPIGMAVSALEFKERYDQFWEEVKAAGMKGEETEIHHGGRVFRIREVAQ